MTVRLGFDLDRYLRASRRVALSHIDWTQTRHFPVTATEARCLAHMMDIESHTVVHLRDLLATRAILEPDVTAFLSCCVYEELSDDHPVLIELLRAIMERAPALRVLPCAVRAAVGAQPAGAQGDAMGDGAPVGAGGDGSPAAERD